MSYRYANSKDMLCGYQLNNIKLDFELFLTELIDAGSRLGFVFKKQNVGDPSWLERRLDDYKKATVIIDAINEAHELERLDEMFYKGDKLPFNSLILSSLLQSAANFGTVHGFNENDCNSLLMYTELMKNEQADYTIGLNSLLFLTLDIKIWNDIVLDFEKKTVMEIDPKIIQRHFNLTPDIAPLFCVLSGYLKSTPQVCRKVIDTFGTSKQYSNVANFIQRALKATNSENMIEKIVGKIFGASEDNVKIVADFKTSLAEFELQKESKSFENITAERLQRMRNDFMNFGEDILCNNLLFINPIFTDLRRCDIKSINDLVIPLLEKTAGALLTDSNDFKERSVMILEEHEGEFVKKPLRIERQEGRFNLIQFAVKFSSRMMSEMEEIPNKYHLDIYVLFYLLRNNSISIIESQIMMKTLVDVRRRKSGREKMYPEIVNERA